MYSQIKQLNKIWTYKKIYNALFIPIDLHIHDIVLISTDEESEGREGEESENVKG